MRTTISDIYEESLEEKRIAEWEWEWERMGWDGIFYLTFWEVV